MLWAFDELVFDAARLELQRAGARVKADAQVLQLLGFLLEHRDQLVSKDALLEGVWQGRALGDNVISVCVAKLRKVLGDDPQRYISNVYGRGYRFTADVRTLERASPSAALPPAGPPPDADLVGRAFVLGRLAQGLARTAAGRGGLCTLLGEAGIGKTRVAEEVAQSARAQGMQVAWGRFEDAQDTPVLSGWLQIAAATGSEGPPALADGGAPLPGAWSRTARWLSELCTRLMERGTWLLVLDDVQWADAASLVLLGQLAREISQARLYVVLTLRDTDLPGPGPVRSALDYVLGHRSNERLQLARLVESDVARYLAHMHGPADATLTRAVYSKSEGNPFFMVELARLLGDDAQATALEVTGPALAIVRQALHKLPGRCHDVLGAAAVMGRTFELATLAAVLEREASEVLDALEPALARHVLLAAPDTHSAFTFGHDLTRRVLYEELPRKKRAAYHVAVAAALRARPTTDQTSRAVAETARHLLAALPDGDVTAAITASRDAAEAAQRVGAHADACSLLRKALDAEQLLPRVDSEVHAGLLFALALAERAAGEPAFLEHLLAAVNVAHAHGLGTLLAAAGESMCGGPGTVVMPAAASTLEAALAVLAPGQAHSKARALAYLTGCAPYCFDQAQVDALLTEARMHAAGDAAAELVVLRHRLYFAGGPGESTRADALMNEIRSFPGAYTPQHAARVMSAEFDRLLDALQRGEEARAQRMLQMFGMAAQSLRHAELLWHHDRIAAIMRLNNGTLDDAQAFFVELAQRAEALGLHGRAEIRAVDEVALQCLVRPTATLPVELMQLLHLAATDPPNVQASKLRVLVDCGELQSARAGLDTLSPAALHELPRSRDYLSTLQTLAHVSVMVGDRSRAALLHTLLEPHADLFSVSISFHNAGSISLQLARLSALLEDAEGALQHYERALQAHVEHGFVPLATATRVELARALQAARGSEAATRVEALRAQARADAHRLGLNALLSELDADLG